MENNNIKQFISDFNKSDLRRRLIPMELASGWPSLQYRRGEVCVTIPYFRARRDGQGRYLLYALYCTVTLLWKSGRMVDFSAFPFDNKWKKVDFSKPMGLFPHQAIAGLGVEYKQKQAQLFGYYDELIACMDDKRAFEYEAQMQALFAVMMEPAHYIQYLAISPSFFKHYCPSIEG